MRSNTPLLQLRGITKRFGGTLALDEASLSVAPAEVHALLGENGSGKSTLMKISAGVYRADSGTIEFGGEEVRFSSPNAAALAGIGIVHQELNLVPVLSAAENLFLGHEPRSFLGLADFREMRRRTEELFSQLEIAIDPSVPVGQLPVALRQMVEIARALTRKVRLLILDEPTSALSDSEIQTLFRVVRRLREAGTGVIYISHKMPEIFALADRYTVLRDGQTVAAGLITEVSEADLVGSMVGRQLGDYYPARIPPDLSLSDKKPILRVENVSRPGAVHGISFELRRGEILGIAGLVGAGRTELLETLFGAAGSTWTGNILLHGNRITPSSPAEAIISGIGLVTEDRAALGIFKLQSVLANSTIAELPRLSRLGILSSSRERDALARQSGIMRIKRASDSAPIDSLSGGNQQKVILARWLMTNPKVLLLDEPTRGIDVGAKAEIYRVLRALADSGIGVLFVSSELPEVLGLADRILVMSAGQITLDIPAQEASESILLKAAMVNLN